MPPRATRAICILQPVEKLESETHYGDTAHIPLALQVRFSKHVFPGETLKVEAWKVDDTTSTSSPAGSTKVVFRTWVVQRGVLAVTNAAIELLPPSQPAARL